MSGLQVDRLVAPALQIMGIQLPSSGSVCCGPGVIRMPLIDTAAPYVLHSLPTSLMLQFCHKLDDSSRLHYMQHEQTLRLPVNYCYAFHS